MKVASKTVVTQDIHCPRCEKEIVIVVEAESECEGQIDVTILHGVDEVD